MDTLPQSSSTPPSTSSPVSTSGSLAKESEVVRIAPTEATPVNDSSSETPLSPEVMRARLRMRADSIELPKTVQQLGVSPVSQAPVSAVAIPTIVLPLTDEQIARGLHQSITSSFRWLAEWCEKRLKEFHFIVRTIGSKTVREKV